MTAPQALQAGERDQFDLHRDPKHNYLLTEALQSRYVLAAHHLSGCEHIIEIGSFQTPITPFLTKVPQSVTVIDPLIDPLHIDQLNGRPCKVRHVAKSIEDHRFVLRHGTYGLVMLGLDLKFPPNRPDVAARIFHRLVRLIDNAHITIVECAAGYKPATDQVAYLLDHSRADISVQMELNFKDDSGATQFNPHMDKAYLHRKLWVVTPKSN